MRKWMMLVVGFAALATVAFGASCSLTIQGDGNGYGEVLIEPGGIVCDIDAGGAGQNCFQDVTWGAHDYTLTATADNESSFEGWAGDCDTIVDNVCTIHFDGLDQHFVVTVTFLYVDICNTNVESQGEDTVTTTC